MTSDGSYFGDWRQLPHSCNACGWSGTGDQLKVGEMFEALCELDCPKCSTKVTFVSYPTVGEMRENADKLTEREKEFLKKMDSPSPKGR